MELDLLRSKEEVRRMTPAIRTLAAETLPVRDATYLPDYFLPRVAAASRPRVVLCFERGAMVGVVYTEELYMLGTRTGWVFGGDEMGRGLVLSAPEREAEVLACACEYLLQHGSHGLRLTWRSSGQEPVPILRLERRGVQVWCRTEVRPEGDWLELAPNYESFLQRLGRHTRRNMRAYRRKAESIGFRFLPELSLASYERAIQDLNRIARFPSTRERELRDRRFFQQFGTPVLAGLAGPDGKVLSALGGVRSGQHLHVLTQLNRESSQEISVSLVLRGYLIEHLIAQGVTSIHFVNGTSPMLGRFCEPVPLCSIAIDSRRSALHPVKLATAHAAQRWQRNGRRVPVRLRGLLGSYLPAH